MKINLSKIYSLSLILFGKILMVLFVLVVLLSFRGEVMANETVGKIEEEILRATVRIETPAHTSGTGFIISKAAENNMRYFFLVTNKHLIGDYLLFDGRIETFYDFIKIFCYKKNGSAQEIIIPLKDADNQINKQKVFLYPDSHIDIAVISIADDLEKINDLNKSSVDLSYLLNDKTLKDLNIDIGDQVFVLGYPHNIYSKSNNYPIAKSGYIASKIGEELILPIPHKDANDKTVMRQLIGKIILLDGTLVPGNSGGPVVMPHGKRERENLNTNKVEFTTGAVPNLVLGIQSQSWRDAGISIAFSSEYILKLIDDIFKNVKEH